MASLFRVERSILYAKRPLLLLDDIFCGVNIVWLNKRSRRDRLRSSFVCFFCFACCVTP